MFVRSRNFIIFGQTRSHCIAHGYTAEKNQHRAIEQVAIPHLEQMYRKRLTSALLESTKCVFCSKIELKDGHINSCSSVLVP